MIIIIIKFKIQMIYVHCSSNYECKTLFKSISLILLIDHMGRGPTLGFKVLLRYVYDESKYLLVVWRGEV